LAANKLPTVNKILKLSPSLHQPIYHYGHQLSVCKFKVLEFLQTDFPLLSGLFSDSSCLNRVTSKGRTSVDNGVSANLKFVNYTSKVYCRFV